jgi:hypothetical protein
MDPITWGFIFTVIFDFVILLFLVISFCFLKKYRSNPDPSSQYEVFLHESSVPFSTLISKIIKTPLSEIKIHCGEESHHYLYLIKVLAIFTSVVGLYSILILLPTYSTGNYNNSELYAISFGNIRKDARLLSIPLIVFLLNIVCCYYVLKLYTQESQKGHSSSTNNVYAARILRLPMQVTPEKLAKDIANILGVGMEHVYVVPRLSKALVYEERLQLAKTELLHYLDYEKSKHTRALFRKYFICGKKFDAIDYWEHKVKKLNGKIENEFKYAKNETSGVCIVQTSAPANIKEIKNLVQRSYPDVEVTSIVHPQDLKWENIEIDSNTAKTSHLCLTVVFFYVFIIFLTPVTFLSYIHRVLNGFDLASSLIGFLSMYLPEILILVYQLLLVPSAVKYLVKQEKHYSKSHDIVSAMRKYLLFFLFNMVFVPAIGLQVVEIVTDALDTGSFNTWSKDMVERINGTSILFMSFIVTQTFIVNAIDLVQPSRMLEVKFNAFRALSEREKYLAYMHEKADYAHNYAVLLTCFTAILIYSISYPLILLFGSLYLWIRVRSM